MSVYASTGRDTSLKEGIRSLEGNSSFSQEIFRCPTEAGVWRSRTHSAGTQTVVSAGQNTTTQDACHSAENCTTTFSI